MRRKLITSVCPTCGREFIPEAKQLYSGKRPFCSIACRWASYEHPHERLFKEIEIDTRTGCWLWTGPKDTDGYGRIHTRRGSRNHVLIPRLSAHFFRGFDMDDPLCILHCCDNPPCFNPDHLFKGTKTDNLRDRDRKGRGVWVRGERQWMAKMTAQKVAELRQFHAAGVPRSELAKRFGIHVGTVLAIVQSQITASASQTSSARRYFTSGHARQEPDGINQHGDQHHERDQVGEDADGVGHQINPSAFAATSTGSSGAAGTSGPASWLSS